MKVLSINIHVLIFKITNSCIYRIIYNFTFYYSEYLVLEQVCVAALDCYRLPLAEYCIKILMRAFPGSLRVHKYHAMHLEALEM